MNYLSIKSAKRLQRYFPFFGQFAIYRLASYLPLWVSSSGLSLTYSPCLNPHKFIPPKQSNHFALQSYLSSINKDYLYSKCLLNSLYQNQIITLEQTNQLIDDIVGLDLLGMKDIIYAMMATQVQYDLKDWIRGKQLSINNYDIHLKKHHREEQFNQLKRKNFFIQIHQHIHTYQQLQTEVLHKYKFLEMPNINKILCLDFHGKDILKFNDNLVKNQQFFKQKNIKIKNISTQKMPAQFGNEQLTKGYRTYKLIEYISKQIKGNSLLHPCPSLYSFYNLTLSTAQLSHPQLQRLLPTQVFLLIQRQSQLNPPSSNRVFSQFNKNFTYRYEEDPFYGETDGGFIVARYLTNANKLKYHKTIQMELEQLNG